jgi:peptidoglycan/LPS O-acetylase OafA/YrhL
MASKRLSGLDGLRGVCALIVVLFHCMAVFPGNVMNHGWLSVDVFFVLSGFVVALRYETELRGERGFIGFFRARARRLIPTQVLGTIAVAAVTLLLFAIGYSATGFRGSAGLVTILGILLIPSFVVPSRILASPHAFPINPPLWSLFDEWIANLVYGVALYRVKTRYAAGLVMMGWAYLLWHAWSSRLGWDASDIYNGAIRATSEFTAGVIVSRLYAAGRLQCLPSWRPEIVYGFWVLVTSIPMVKPLPIFEFLAATGCAAAGVALLARSEHPVPGFFVWLGVLSYPLYASHWAVIRAAQELGARSHNAFLAVPMLGAALALAILVHYAVMLANRSRWYATVLVWARPVRASARNASL